MPPGRPRPAGPRSRTAAEGRGAKARLRPRPPRLCNRGARPLAGMTGRARACERGGGGAAAGSRGAGPCGRAGGAEATGSAARRARARATGLPRAQARRARAAAGVRSRAVVLPAVLGPSSAGGGGPKRCGARPFLSLLVLPSSSRAAQSLGRQTGPARVSGAAGRGSRGGRHAAAGGRGGRRTLCGVGAGLRAAEASGGPGCSGGVEPARDRGFKAGVGLWSRPGPLPLAGCRVRAHFLATQPQSKLFRSKRPLVAGLYLLPPPQAPRFSKNSSWFLAHLQSPGKTKVSLKISG